MDTRTVVVPANTAATFVDMTLDPPSDRDFLDVYVTNPAVAISLIQPGGVEVTAANAAALGFQWTVTNGTGGTLSILDVPGIHITIGIPSTAAGGAWRVKANSSGVNAESALTVLYKSNSGIRAGLTAAAPSYRTGETVVFTAALFRGTVPITGAAINLTITPQNDISSQSAITNYRLVATTPVDANTSTYTYAADLSNAGSARPQVTATVESTSAGVRIGDGTLIFTNVPAAGTKPSEDSLTMTRANSLPFDSSVLQWKFVTSGSSTVIPMTDSGASDAAPNDGLYTGAFVPPAPGDYSAQAAITGTSNGAPFSRKAGASIHVIAPLASFTSFQDQGVDDDGNGLVDRIVSTAFVSVQTSGDYEYALQLRASNGKTLLAVSKVSLSPGSQQIALNFAAKDILETLGVNGPYQRVRAQLVRRDATESTLVDARADAGATAAYTITSLDRGPLYFTGQNSVAGVITSGGSLYDVLRAQVGIYTAGGNCSWSGGIEDQSGNSIDFTSGSSTLPAGVNYLILNFNGMKISRSGKNGPYVVSKVGVQCGQRFLTSPTLVTSPAYSANQFVAGAADYSVSVTPGTLSISAPGGGVASVAVNTTGLFQPHVYLSATGVPSGVTLLFDGGFERSVPSSLRVWVQAESTAVPGSYTISIQAAGGGLSRSTNLTLQITSPSGYSVRASPPGALFTVDGVRSLRVQSYPWFANSTHTLSTTSPQNVNGSRYTFLNWSDGQGISHQITAPASPTHYVANFSVEHRLYVDRKPGEGGSVSPDPVEGFYPAGSSVPVTATPNPGFQFLSWTGLVDNPAAASTTVLMNATKRIRANFVALPTTIAGSLAGEVDEGAYWKIRVSNAGPGAATGVMVEGVTLTQIAGTLACPLSVQSKLPYYLGEIAPGTVIEKGFIMNTKDCQSNAAFRATVNLSANYGAVTNSFIATATTGTLVDVTARARVTSTGLLYSRVTGNFVGTVTIQNTSAQAINGPLDLVFADLTPGVTLQNATGTSISGTPYVLMPNVTTLAPGASASVQVQFRNPTNGFINYTPVVLSGQVH
ncbi:MAG: hypothetical protein IT165_18480 [Bryobacterales bacterium]|nr:hypothetical protein [Bryobacterales bacterium]